METHSITRSGRTAPPHRVSWHAVTTGISLTILATMLVACAPSAQPAATITPAPVAAVAATNPPAKPVEPAAKPAASPAVATTQPVTKPVGPATGQIVIINEAEPDTIVPKEVTSPLGYFVLDNVYDHLTGRDYTSATGKIVPQLAEKLDRVDDHTWRFKLRQDVKFTNGELFNADAVVAAVTDMADPQKPGRGADNYGTLQAAKKVDDFTVEISTKDSDPILPERLVHFAIPAPNWLKTATLETSATQAVGSGPYLLADYQKGNYILFKANPNYWGPDKPKIAEIKYIGRGEQTVRGAMLQTGEADLAFHISYEQAQQVPRSIIEEAPSAALLRINWEHPVMKDIRVRQAIIEAIDTQGMINSLYPGGSAVPMSGQFARQGTVGWNASIKPYPYQPDEARRLLQEAGAVGTPVEYVDRPSQFPRAGEVGELVVTWLNQVGFKATLRHLEAAPFLEALLSVKPDQKRTDLQMTSINNPLLDSSRVFDIWYACGGRYRIGCDQEFDRRYAEAKVLMGDARDQAFQSLWEYAYDKLWYMPLFGLNWVDGASARLQWTPRIDGVVLFTEMSLTP